jgi:transposase
VFFAHAGDITRFPPTGRVVGYLGLDPKARQSGHATARTARISKDGASLVRHVLVEAAHTAVRSPGPLRAFYERIRARRGHEIAIVAVAARCPSCSGTCSPASATTPTRAHRDRQEAAHDRTEGRR